MNSSRRFGVEIECVGEPSRVIACLADAGIQARFEHYNHIDSDRWKITTDASVRGSSGRGIELVSPPMSGEEGRAQIAAACRALRQAGAIVNRTCGLHVHHDASDLDGMRLRGLVRLYQRSERVLDSLHPASRQASYFCQTMQGMDVWEHACDAGLDDAGAYAKLIEDRYTRYRKLNLAAYRRHGTVEFRQHAGTLNAEKIWAWVVLTQAMVEKAAGGRLDLNAQILPSWERVKQALGLTTYWGGTMTEQAAGEFYNARRISLRAAGA
jgi:hypothetical protein